MAHIASLSSWCKYNKCHKVIGCWDALALKWWMNYRKLQHGVKIELLKFFISLLTLPRPAKLGIHWGNWLKLTQWVAPAGLAHFGEKSRSCGRLLLKETIVQILAEQQLHPMQMQTLFVNFDWYSSPAGWFVHPHCYFGWRNSFVQPAGLITSHRPAPSPNQSLAPRSPTRLRIRSPLQTNLVSMKATPPPHFSKWGDVC